MSHINTLVRQKLTYRQKKKDFGSVDKWGQNVLDGIFGANGHAGFHYYGSSAGRKTANYDLLAGLINQADFRNVISPYGKIGDQLNDEEWRLPANFKHFDLISPKVRLLKGEEIKRPFNFRVIAENSEISTEILRMKNQFYIDRLMKEFVAESESQGTPIQPEEGVPENIPEDIEKYTNMQFRSSRELAGNQALEFLIRDTDANNKFNEGFEDLLTVDEEIYRITNYNKRPDFERINPIYFDCQKGPDTRWIEESEWAAHTRFITPGQVLDEFHTVLETDEVEQIDNTRGHTSNQLVLHPERMRATIVIDNGSESGSRNTDNIWDEYEHDGLVAVDHVAWRGMRKIGIRTFQDDLGQEQESIVDEFYKPSKFTGESVEWFWISEAWEATRIDGNIYKYVRPVPNQPRRLDNLSFAPLPYVGISDRSKNSRFYSFVDIMKPVQYFYDIIMFRVELEIARSKGKKMIMDLAQIPKSWGIDIKKWLYYLDNAGIGFINSFEEGKGKNAGKTSHFNQFNQIDLSMAQVINQYVEFLSKLEDMIDSISGVSKQRQGSVSRNELVGSVERSVVQSSHVTEEWFYKHGEVKKRLLQRLLHEAQNVWPEGKVINYILDTGARIMFEIDSEFADTEYGLFVSNSTEDAQLFEAVKGLAQAAMQNSAATFADIVKVLKSKSIANAENVLEESANKIQEENQAQREAADKINQDNIAAQDAREQRELDAKDQISIRESAVKLAVANVQLDASDNDNESKERMSIDRLQEVLANIGNDNLKKQVDLQISRESNETKKAIAKQSKS